MPSEINDDALEFLLARAGLHLTPEQKADLKSVYPGIAAMAERVRKPRGRMAEPAHIYRLRRGGSLMAGTIPTIAEAARQIAAKELSPVELTRTCLDRVHALDDQIHAFIHLTEERAIAEARVAEAAIMANGPSGPLHGIPIGLKDIVDTKGIPTTCQSKFLADNIPEADAACAEQLAAAGAVLIGKTTTHEFADGGPSFDLPWPPARNPWNTDHFTAGSSSGTGAGVAAGMILGGIGTDTGGSIRGPAALCGIAGIKPTYGLVSRAGVAPAAFSLDHIGPMAWTAEDCALMLQALAGHDPRDPASASRAGSRLHRPARQARQGAQGRRYPSFPRDRLQGQPRHPARHRRRYFDAARPRRRNPRGAPFAIAGLGRLRLADLDHRARRRL